MADTRVHQPQARRGCSSLRGARDAGGCGGRNLRRFPSGNAHAPQQQCSARAAPQWVFPTYLLRLHPALKHGAHSPGPAAPLPRTLPPTHGGDWGPRAAPGVTGDIPAPSSAETARLEPLPASAETST